MFSKILLGLPALSLLAATASAQAFNIDINVPPGSVPISTYGAFSGVAGTWNAGSPGTTVALRQLNGVLDANSDLSISTAGVGTNGGALLPTVDADLMLDYMINDNFIETITIDDLDAGDYTLVLYSWAPTNNTFFRANSGGFTQDQGVVTSPSTYPGFSQGESVLTLSFTIFSQNDDLTIEMLSEGTSVLNGIQVFPTFGTAGCTQPTTNSQGGIPDIIGTGSDVAAANGLVVRAGVLPGALPGSNPMNPGAIVTFVSNFQNANAPFLCPINGSVTGLRCIGNGNLARVATGAAGAVGFISSDGTYSLPVDLNQLATQGINVSPGSTLYFQMVYRDFPDPVQCNSNLVRWTNSVGITLQ